MKTKLIIMSLILSLSSSLYAGPCEKDNEDCHKGGSHKGQKMRERRTNDLNLSEAQQKSFEAIMKDQRESMKAAKDAIHAETKAKLSNVLSAEQMELLEQKHKKREKAQKRSKKKMRKQMERRKKNRENKDQD